MTPAELQKIDYILAEKVMGWKLGTGPASPGNGRYVINGWWNADGEYLYSESGPKRWGWQPTRNIAHAWLVWEKLASSCEFYCMDIRKPVGEGWEVSLRRVGHDEDRKIPFVLIGGEDSEMSATLCICLAALKANGIEIPGEK